ncbi:Phosphatidylglycerophosphatase A [Vibrio chagasii]|nr:Phosphatidylglycerophosphatase A [Vibrio chagasii]
MSNTINLRKPTHLIATVFGSGLAPKASGTFGTIASLPFCVYMLHTMSLMTYMVTLVVLTLVSVIICNKVSDDLGEHDSGKIVIDEFAGVMLTLAFIPEITIFWVLVSFFAFRFFDVLKPFPIGWLDANLENGWGIMLDDIAAGFAAGLVVIGLGYFI